MFANLYSMCRCFPPGPQYPPVAVALIPNNGKRLLKDIYKHHVHFAQDGHPILGIKIISGASDEVAAPELATQKHDG